MNESKMALAIDSVIDEINKHKPSSKDWVECLNKVVSGLGFALTVNRRNGNLGGNTDGKNIQLFGKWGESELYFSLFHELAHALLHFPLPENGLSKDDICKMETEADAVAVYLCDLIWPNRYDMWVSCGRRNLTRSLLEE